MQPQSKPWLLPAAIIIAALLVCATLLVLNLRTTYRIGNAPGEVNGQVYVRLLTSGCSVQTSPGFPEQPVSVTCPLWIRP